ncbi:MAG TPA: hypothetical protein VD998_00260 [Verrucomicrobiae bacterium]|nr:hypothetical protein [Verrucomicrobiae bacterium]
MDYVFAVFCGVVFLLMALAPLFNEQEQQQKRFKRLYRRFVLNRLYDAENWKTKDPNYARVKLAVSGRKLILDQDQIKTMESSNEKTTNQIPAA